MKTKRLLALLGCILVLFLISTAYAVPVSVLECPQGPPTPGLEPQYGGTLKLIIQRSVKNLGATWKRNSNASTMNRFVIEGLIGLNNKGEPVPQLAESWKADPVKKTITFKLRKGVKFHDGTDFNAEAVKWNLDMFRNGDIGAILKRVESVDVLDNYTVRMNLSKWEPLLLQDMSYSGAGKMSSPTAAQKMGDAIMDHPVGTGPFEFVSYKANVSYKVKKFEGYWQKGLPYLDAVEVSFVADPMVGYVSLTKGESHFLDFISTIDAEKLQSMGFTIKQNLATIGGLVGDSKNSNSPFSDIRIRRALAYGIDAKAAVEAVYGKWNPVTNQLAYPGMTAYNPDIKGYPYDPDKSRKLLAEAGYSTRKPLKIKITYTTDPQITDLYTVFQGYLKEVGIDLQLEIIEGATFVKNRAKGWNNALLQLGLAYNGIETSYTQTMSMNLCHDATRFVSTWIPDEIDALYQKVLSVNDPAKREEIYRQVNKIAVDDYCVMIPMYLNYKRFAHSPKLHDFGLYELTAAEYLPERAWLSK